MLGHGSRAWFMLAGGLFAPSLAGCAAGDAAEPSSDAVGGGGGAGGEDVATSSTSGSGGSGGEEDVYCAPGQQTSCPCVGGATGVQVCLEDGSGYGPCTGCPDEGHGGGGGEGGAGSGGGGGGSDPCGDALCADDESCHTCEADCGPCAPCLEAPACDNAMVPPAQLEHVPELDVPKMEYVPPEAILQRLASLLQEAGPGARLVSAALSPEPLPGEGPLVAAVREAFAAHPAQADALRRQIDLAGRGLFASKLHDRLDLPELAPPGSELGQPPLGGTVECGAPLLRVRVAKIDVHEEDDDWANDIVYCAIAAEGGAGGELKVTPPTSNLDEGDEYVYGLESGVFWGQKGPTTPGGNLMITYDCFEQDSNDGYQSLIDAIGNAAGQVGGSGIAGQYGWVFTVVGAVAPVVSGALALDGDDHLYNASQIIPLDKQLAMTNGRFWTVRREGTHLGSDWDWELRIEAWGCAEYGEKK